MGVERGPGADRGAGRDDSSDRGESSDRDGPQEREQNPDGDGSPGLDDSLGPGEPSGRVHVRRLDVLDTLRWSREVLGDRRELFGLALGVSLPSVVAVLGITRPSPTADPEFADWVVWLYLVQLLATLVAWGAVYLTAADAVANRSESLAGRLVTATRRLPALVATAVVTAVLVGASLLPAVAVTQMMRGPGGLGLGIAPSVGPVVGLLLVVAFGLVAVYVFFRLLLAYPACVVDRKGPIASPRAGWRAGTGIVRKVFAVSVVYVVVVGLVNVLAGAASNVAVARLGGWYDVASTLVSAAFNVVLLPMFALALAHLYLEGSRNR